MGSFAANQFGLYDMGGNVWQWCEDEYSPGDEDRVFDRVLRGAAWNSSGLDDLLASYRNSDDSDSHDASFGFRCVIAFDAAASIPGDTE